jgi:hypothetical protein
MQPRHFRILLFCAIILLVTTQGYYCTSPQQLTSVDTFTSPWRNVYDTTVRYVGMDVCKGCHQQVYDTYIQTGMGQSFDYATHAKSAADFSPAHALVYDTALDFYYKPYWDGDSLTILEYRLKDGDTVHQRLQRISYIVGSGQHTNSHIFSANGFLYQAPITFYTQQHRWDLAPGFEKGGSSRFNRLIQLECMSCHNGYPDFVAGSENKFKTVKRGIDCERCHGPGSLHVDEKMAGKLIDTSKTPDYSIVNPRRLSTDLQNNVCQRCHLQGIAVLNDGKTFFDYRPGMQLKQVMNVFMPEYEGAKDKMIMASHVERMKKSECFIMSNKMSCITCHNPHISVKFTPHSQYINACNSCHGPANKPQCTEAVAARRTNGDDCIACHMPRNGSIDIPHVAVTDHYIRKRPKADTANSQITAFLGMRCFNNDNPDAITKARGFIEFYERYAPAPGLLDSAIKYLDADKTTEIEQKYNKDYIRIAYLREDYAQVIALCEQLKPARIVDGWTAYRVAEALERNSKAPQAVPWYQRAVALLPLSLDFQNKYAGCLIGLGRLDEAKAVCESVLLQNSKNAGAAANLGFVLMKQGKMPAAIQYLSAAHQLNPDNQQNLINLAVWYYSAKNYRESEKFLFLLLNKYPNNQQGQLMLSDLQKYL